MALPNRIVTRFPNGFTNIGPNKPLSQMPQPDPTKCHIFFDDFNDYIAGDWTVTETQAGATQALTAGNGGQILLTNTNTLSDECTLATVKKDFNLSPSKKHWCSARLKLSNTTNGTFGFGVGDVASIATGTNVVQAYNGVDVSAPAAFEVISYGNSSNVGFAGQAGNFDNPAGGFFNLNTPFSAYPTITANVFATIGWYYDGQGILHCFKDDVLVASMGIPSSCFPVGDLYAIIGVYCQTAGANTMTVDYFMFAQER